MIRLLLILTIIAWPFGQLLQLTPIGGGIRFHLIDLLTTFISLSLLVSAPARRKIIADPLFRPFAFFVLACATSLVVVFFGGGRENLLLAVLFFLRFVSYLGVLFAFRLEGLAKYMRYILLSTALFLAIGFLQYLILPDVRFIKYLGFDDHYFRLIGSLLDPNYTGLVLAAVTLVSPWPALLLPLLGLVLTFSRASFLALAVGLIYLGTAKKKLRLLLLLLLLGFIIYLVPKPFGEGVNLTRTFSIFSRWQNQQAAFDLFLKNPIFGVGFNSLKSAGLAEIPNLTSGVDNSLLFVLTTTGLVGFSAFLYLMRSIWLSTKEVSARAALVAVFIHSLFNNSLFYSWVLLLVFVLLNLRPRKSA